MPKESKILVYYHYSRSVSLFCKRHNLTALQLHILGASKILINGNRSIKRRNLYLMLFHLQRCKQWRVFKESFSVLVLRNYFKYDVESKTYFLTSQGAALIIDFNNIYKLIVKRSFFLKTELKELV